MAWVGAREVVPPVASEALFARKANLEKQLSADHGEAEKIQGKRRLLLQQRDTEVGNAFQAL